MYHVIDATGTLVRSEPITLPRSVMMHDFAVTRENVLFFDLPVVFDLETQPFPFRWDDDHPARVGVMPRAGGDADVRWFDVDPCYVFHPMNAFDDGDSVVVDVPRHPTMFKQSNVGPNDGGAPTLERWTIDLAAGKVREERIDERGQEFPRVNETLLGSRHRFGYAVGVPNTHDAFDGATLLQARLRGAASRRSTTSAPGRTPGEFVFVPSEAATSEDDGWLMGYVYDAATDRSDLVILDAHDFTAPPVATVHLPARVPYGFHGSWIPDAEVTPTTRTGVSRRLMDALSSRRFGSFRREPGGFGFAHRGRRRAGDERPELLGDAAEVRGRVQAAEHRGEAEVDALRDHERGRDVRRASRRARTGRSRRSTCGPSPTSTRARP